MGLKTGFKTSIWDLMVSNCTSKQNWLLGRDSKVPGAGIDTEQVRDDAES